MAGGKKPGGKKKPSSWELAAATLQGALAGVSTGAGAGVTVGAWLAKVAVVAAFVDPTLITPIVLGTVGACVGGALKYKEKSSKGSKP
jgi:ABC-type nitrate/sulfonate/bicarbonate transport system permease component